MVLILTWSNQTRWVTTAALSITWLTNPLVKESKLQKRLKAMPSMSWKMAEVQFQWKLCIWKPKQVEFFPTEPIQIQATDITIDATWQQDWIGLCSQAQSTTVATSRLTMPEAKATKKMFHLRHRVFTKGSTFKLTCSTVQEIGAYCSRVSRVWGETESARYPV